MECNANYLSENTSFLVKFECFTQNNDSDDIASHSNENFIEGLNKVLLLSQGHSKPLRGSIYKIL